jgi:acyl-CoA thioesterase I
MKSILNASVVVILLSLFLSACANHRGATLKPSRYPGFIRVACVGDSITYGAGLEDRDHQSYPAVLGQRLGPKFQTRNFGVNGATLLKKGDKPYWTQPEFRNIDEFAPHIVLVLLGTNDSKPPNWNHQADFIGDLRDLIRHIANLPGKPRVWLCLPPPVYTTQSDINEKTLNEEIIPALLQVAQEKKLPIIDLHFTMGNRPELFSDKIHPNAAGAALMAKTVGDALLGQ